MGSRRSSAKPYRTVCEKCGFEFTIMAFLSKGVDKDAWLTEQAKGGHDCAAAAAARTKSLGVERVGQQKQKKK